LPSYENGIDLPSRMAIYATISSAPSRLKRRRERLPSP